MQCKANIIHKILDMVIDEDINSTSTPTQHMHRKAEADLNLIYISLN